MNERRRSNIPPGIRQGLPSKEGPSSREGLAEMFSRLGGVIRHLEGLVESGGEEIRRGGEFNIPGLGEKARGIYGFSVRTGLDGEARVRPFGNIKPTKSGPEVVDVREPLIDVFDEGDELLIVAELPGVSDREIEVAVSDGLLTLQATGEHRYAKELELTVRIEAEPTRRLYRNGLLELRFAKASE